MRGLSLSRGATMNSSGLPPGFRHVLFGEAEIALVLGLAVATMDFMHTSQRMCDSDHQTIEDIIPVDGKMIVDRAAVKTDYRRINTIIVNLDAVIYEEM
jgi:ATP phosphoribosyltransferase